MCYCGLCLCLKKHITNQNQEEDLNWDELAYLKNDTIDFIYNEVMKNIETSNEVQKKIDKKVEMFLTYLLLSIGGIVAYSLKQKVQDGLFLTFLFSWVGINAYKAIQTINYLFVPNNKDWYHQHFVPYFAITKLHFQDDESDFELRLIKQRNLPSLHDIAIKHDRNVDKRQKELANNISTTIGLNLIAFALVLLSSLFF